MGYSGSVAIWALKEGRFVYQYFEGTTAGLQAAIDYLKGGKGTVFIGPGTLETTTAIWAHENTRIEGSGRDKTIIKRKAGSITDSDPANSGCVIGTSKYGFNGTLSSASQILNDIEIRSLTVDGNYTAFGSLTNTGTVQQAGILAKSVNGLRIIDVCAQNTLRSGFMIMECKKVRCHRCKGDTNGQFSLVTTRNAFDFYNFGFTTPGHAVDYILSDFEVYNCGDEAISLTAASDVVIANGYIDGCDMVLETQLDGTAGHHSRRISMQNIVAKNLLNYPLTLFFGSGGNEISDYKVSDCVFWGHDTNHGWGAISCASGATTRFVRGTFQNLDFYNLNTLDTNVTSLVWGDFIAGTGYIREVTLKGVRLHGKSGAVKTNYGFVFAGSISGVEVIDCHVEDATAIAYAVWNFSGASNPEFVDFRNCTARNIGNHGWFIGANEIGHQVNDITIEDCSAYEIGKGGAASQGVILQNNAAGSTNRVVVRRFRGTKVSAANFNIGIQVTAGSGTTDDVTIEDCILRGIATSYSLATNVTNPSFRSKVKVGANITAAATIAIPLEGEVFHVTGNTNITNGITVRAWDNGRIITLIFDGTPTVSDTGTSKLFADLVATADDTLTLRCDGTNWYEVSRSAN